MRDETIAKAAALNDGRAKELLAFEVGIALELPGGLPNADGHEHADDHSDDRRDAGRP